MRIHNRIPAGAVGNADIFGSSKLADGERVIDTQVAVEQLQIQGTLVLKESTVVGYVRKLGYRVETEDEYSERNADMLVELETLRAKAARLDEIEAVLGNVETDTAIGVLHG